MCLNFFIISPSSPASVPSVCVLFSFHARFRAFLLKLRNFIVDLVPLNDVLGRRFLADPESDVGQEREEDAKMPYSPFNGKCSNVEVQQMWTDHRQRIKKEKRKAKQNMWALHVMSNQILFIVPAEREPHLKNRFQT